MTERMTCQCCGRAILAGSGRIAHHGYQRPDTGWQTASCMGARALPFEVDRAKLGEMLESLRRSRDLQILNHKAVAAEARPIPFTYTDWKAPRSFGARRPEVTIQVTRLTFDEHKEVMVRNCTYRFEDLKDQHLAVLGGRIENLRRFLAEQQARFDGWTQTHQRLGSDWVRL